MRHDRILYKLEQYGIRTDANLWFRSYLNNRRQLTLFNGCESNLADINQGVPQGSTLGPFLYISYVNDCFDILGQDCTSKIIMYADDTVLLSYGENADDVQQSNQLLFDRYVDWTATNGLKINVSKTKHMIICTKSANTIVDMNCHIKAGNSNISNTVLYKYLGCNLDRNLSLEPFVKDTSGAALC